MTVILGGGVCGETNQPKQVNTQGKQAVFSEITVSVIKQIQAVKGI